MAYNGISPYLYKNSVSTVDIFDDISGSFNGSTTTFNITVGGAAYTRFTAKACLIVLGGIVQEAGIDYTVNAGQITFTTAPSAGLTFEGRHLFGLNGVDTPTLGSVYPATLSTGGPYWDTSGNVGIGTTSPQARLDVTGFYSRFIGFSSYRGNAYTIASFSANNTQAPLNIVQRENGTHPGISAGQNSTGTFQPLSLLTSETLRVLIDASGNVGIGTTNPDALLRIQGGYAKIVNGTSTLFLGDATSLVSSPPTNSSAIRFDSDNLTFSYSNSSQMTITSSGNVGIGITNPTTKLHILTQTNWGTSTNNSLTIGNSATTGDTNVPQNLGRVIWQTNGQDAASIEAHRLLPADGNGTALIFSTNVGGNTTSTTERVRIQDTGNVGIGTTNPQQKLHVEGNLRLGTDPYIQWLSNYLRFQTANASVPVIEFRESSSGNYEPRMDFYDGDGTTRNISINANPSEVTYFNAGNVGIGTTDPTEKLEVNGNLLVGSPVYNNTGSPIIRLGHQSEDLVNGTQRGVIQFDSIQDFSVNGGDAWKWKIATVARPGSSGNYNSQLEILRTTRSGVTDNTDFCISRTGNIGIGTTNPSRKLHVEGDILTPNRGLISRHSNYKEWGTLNGTSGQWFDIGTLSDTMSARFIVYGYAHTIVEFIVQQAFNTRRITLLSATRAINGNYATIDGIRVCTDNTVQIQLIWSAGPFVNVGVHVQSMGIDFNGVTIPDNLISATRTMADEVYTSSYTARFWNNLRVEGTLSKGAGSFQIDHPLPSKKDTHYLVHSFTESPQADLIYRDKVQLQNGTAVVNIDETVGMTEGTFEVLCRNVQCFTTNETGWTAVKGSVTGNILTIVSEDSNSTDTISWMVIGERNDPFIRQSDMTDEDGRVIVEPLKPQ